MSDFSPRLLYVEDDADSREMLSIMLTLTWDGCRVCSVSNGDEALRKMDSESFDLYILDSQLPDMSGYELCRRIRARDPRTPVLFFSASALPRHRETAREAGASAYLCKPNDLDIFPDMVKTLIG